MGLRQIWLTFFFCKATSSGSLQILVLLDDKQGPSAYVIILLWSTEEEQARDVHHGSHHWSLKGGNDDVVRQVQYSLHYVVQNKTEPVVSRNLSWLNKKKDQDNYHMNTFQGKFTQKLKYQENANDTLEHFNSLLDSVRLAYEVD